MTEDRGPRTEDLEALIDKLETALLWIAQYDHQKAAQDVLVAGMLSGDEEREVAYREVLEQVAQTDIQAWAKAALKQIQKTKEQGQ
jgi:trehalose-6-phosphate synthase